MRESAKAEGGRSKDGDGKRNGRMWMEMEGVNRLG